MMIEADVSMGTITGREGKFLPIMAHPPFKTSDLSLEEFVDIALSSRPPKGIKLDFKDMEVVELSLMIIKARANKVGLNKLYKRIANAVICKQTMLPRM